MPFLRDNLRMSEQVDIFFERLDERRRALGLSDRALSLKAGASQDLVRTARGKWHVPNSTNLAGLARAMGVTTDWLLGSDAGFAAEIPSEARISEESLRQNVRRGRSSLRVLGTGHCGTVTFNTDSGEVEIEQTLFEPASVIRYVTRPLALMGVEDAYAIYFVGESMFPRFQAGDMGIVDPRRPPAPGDDVLVQLCANGSDEITSVLVKRLIRRSPSFIELQQYNPAAIFRVPAERVARIHRIVTLAELLGG